MWLPTLDVAVTVAVTVAVNSPNSQTRGILYPQKLIPHGPPRTQAVTLPPYSQLPHAAYMPCLALPCLALPCLATSTSINPAKRHRTAPHSRAAPRSHQRKEKGAVQIQEHNATQQTSESSHLIASNLPPPASLSTPKKHPLLEN